MLALASHIDNQLNNMSQFMQQKKTASNSHITESYNLNVQSHQEKLKILQVQILYEVVIYFHIFLIQLIFTISNNKILQSLQYWWWSWKEFKLLNKATKENYVMNYSITNSILRKWTKASPRAYNDFFWTADTKSIVLFQRREPLLILMDMKEDKVQKILI